MLAFCNDLHFFFLFGATGDLIEEFEHLECVPTDVTGGKIRDVDTSAMSRVLGKVDLNEVGVAEHRIALGIENIGEGNELA